MSPTDLDELISTISSTVSALNEISPLVILHSSGGVGRVTTIIGIMRAIDEFKTGKKKVNLNNIVLHMRRQRDLASAEVETAYKMVQGPSVWQNV